MLLIANCLFYFPPTTTQEKTLHHKNVEHVTKTSPAMNSGIMGKSEEEAAEKKQISSPSTRNSEKV